jgi:hypothetical protein
LSRPLFVSTLIFALCLSSPVFAQQPLAAAPASPVFLPRYDFHLSAAALANADPRFSWDTHFGGDIDVVDYVYGRTSAILNYEAILGNEFRAFDPNQGNYTLELATSVRLGRTEVAGIFNHVSRHLSDRPKRFPVAWNILGVRVLRQTTQKWAVIDFVADTGGTTQRVNVDYEWSTNASVKVRRQVHRGVGIFAGGAGHLMAVSPERGRGTQKGGEIEGGIRLMGQSGVAEFFAGFERRFDAHQLDFEPRHWFMVGFRVLRQ